MSIVLCTIYWIALVWAILFKFRINIQDLIRERSINLIPLAGTAHVGNHLILYEVRDNILIFIPFGIYMGMITIKPSYLRKILPIAGTSFFVEILQYILAIGVADITDLIGNTLGGMIGIAIYYIGSKMFRTRKRTNKIFNILAFLATLALILFFVFLIIASFLHKT